MKCKHKKLKLNTQITMIDGRMAYKTTGLCLGTCSKTVVAIIKAHKLGKHSLPEAQKAMEQRIIIKLNEAQR